MAPLEYELKNVKARTHRKAMLVTRNVYHKSQRRDILTKTLA